MQNTISQHLNKIGSGPDREALSAILQYVGGASATQAVSTAGLVITATSGKKVPKIGAADAYFLVRGRLVKIAAGTDMPALVGTVTNATFNVYAFFVDSSGTVTSAMGTAGAALGSVKFPDFPINKSPVGFIIVNPTGTGDFVGGTTALDDATVVPGTVYISPVGDFDPTILY